MPALTLYITHIPDILTNGHTESLSLQIKDKALFRRLKITGLIKDVIGG